MQPTRSHPHPLGLRLWLVYAAATTAGGWLLSASHCLHPAGLGFVVLSGAAVWFALTRSDPVRPAARLAREWRRWHRFRGRRALPLLFAAIALVSLGGGLSNDPYNYDALWYRVPRMSHWLAENRWHWIHTEEFRVNASALLSEWMNLPILALTQSRRLLFLTNFTGFLLLPGAFYALLVAMGVSRRVAWHWMWLLPSGWVYAFQAGSLANDMLGAPLALAAMLYGFRAAAGDAASLGWSVIAAALMSNAKLFFVPLLLPWLVCAAPAWRIVFRRPVGSLLVCTIACLVSFLPLAVLSRIHGGGWSGATNTAGFIPAHPLFALPANAAIVVASNLIPPFCPMATAWNAWISGRASQPPLNTWTAGFESFATLPPAIDETVAGLGMGIMLLVLAGLLVPRCAPRRPSPGGAVFRAAVLVATAVFLAKVGTNQCNRYLAPYFPLLLGLVLRSPVNVRLTRSIAWRCAAVVVTATALLLVAVCRQHPFPVTIDLIGWLHRRVPSDAMLARLDEAYSWRNRSVRRFGQLRAGMGDAKAVGFMVYGVGETEFWDAGCRVWHIKPDDLPRRWVALGIRYVVVDSSALGDVPLEAWAAGHHLRPVGKLPTMRRLEGVENPVFLMELDVAKAL